MTAIGELDAASTKAGEEPATPAEGKTTKGVVGVTKRQTFHYKADGTPEQIITIEHDLGTPYVSIAEFKSEKGGAYKPEPGNVKNWVISGSKLTRNTGEVTEEDFIIVLTA